MPDENINNTLDVDEEGSNDILEALLDTDDGVDDDNEVDGIFGEVKEDDDDDDGVDDFDDFDDRDDF